MRKLKYTFSRVALNQIYLSYLLPIIEYSCVVWDGCTERDIESLQKLQNEAARIVTGLTRSVSLDNLYNESGWLSLIERRRQQKLIFMYKSVNGLVPSYVSDLIPPLVGETNAYNLRNNNNITVPFCRTEISRKSCIPSSISAWNSLDIELRNSPSLSSFKYQLKKNTQNNSIVPTYYRVGGRYISVLHARIRNNCSNLFFDLYINHLSPSPTCSCSEEVEDAEHYFFRCSHFINERISLFRSTRNFNPLNVNKLLFGNENLTPEEMLLFSKPSKLLSRTPEGSPISLLFTKASMTIYLMTFHSIILLFIWLVYYLHYYTFHSITFSYFCKTYMFTLPLSCVWILL